jgi:hypothetical protein
MPSGARPTSTTGNGNPARHNERALSQRIAITYRALPGRPMFVAELLDWDFTIQAADSDFEFRPPDGVERVDLESRGGGVTPASPK